jgi:hypothetical protein
MPMFVRLAVALILLGVVAFCIVGFMATYEPPGFPVWRLVYGVAGLTCLAGAARVLFRRAKAE